MTCYPSLGTHEVVYLSPNSKQLHFYASDTPGLQAYSNLFRDGEWRETPFVPLSTGQIAVATFDLSFLQHDASFEFTYRVDNPEGLAWLGSGNNNGTLEVKLADKDVPSSIEEAWQGLPSDTDRVVISSLGEPFSFSLLSFPIPDSIDSGDVYSVSLGKPKSSGQALAYTRSRPTWLESHVLPSLHQLSSDADSQCLVVSGANPSDVVVFLPVSSSSSVSSLRGDLDPTQNTLWLLCKRIAGDGNPQAYCLVGHCKAWQLQPCLDGMIKAAQSHIFQASPRVQEFQTKKLIYCTWDALGSRYTVSKLFEVLSSLEDAGVDEYYDSVLLDDGWQDVNHQRQLQSFSAQQGWMDVQPSKADLMPRRPDSGYASPLHSRNNSGMDDLGLSFNDDLSRAVQLLKLRYPFVKRVGAWVTLQGYWHGLAADSDLVARFSAREFGGRMLEGHDGQWLLPPADQFSSFWLAYFKTLKSAGISFVKVDNQAAMDSLTGEGAEELKKAAYEFLEQANEFWGPANVIHCMAHSPQNVTARFGIAGQSDSIWRAFDDYLPNVEDSHRFLVEQNTRIALLTHCLSLQPDFDMFQTKHPFAQYHSALRVLSPAPITLTEPLNSVDPDIYNQLSAVSKAEDSFTALQARTKPTLLTSNLFANLTGAGSGPAAKLASVVRSVASAIVGTFNCRADQASTVDALTRRDIAEALSLSGAEQADYIVFSPDSRQAVALRDFAVEEELSHDPLTSDPVLPLALPYKGHSAFSIAPWHSVQSSSGASVKVACVGLTDKLAGLAALTHVVPFYSTASHRCAPQSAVVPTFFGRIANAFKLLAQQIRYVFALRWLFGSSQLKDTSERTPLLAERPTSHSNSGLLVHVTHAGQLSFVLDKTDPTRTGASYHFTIDHAAVQQDYQHLDSLSDHLDLLSLDLPSAIGDIEDHSDANGAYWAVELTLS